jgi:mitogen-activated protein kinase kinase kinase 7
MAMSLDKVLYKTREGGLHANLPFKTKLSLLQDVARAVAFMHGKEQPICHRDLKPSNILLDKATSTAKICDFGTSRSISTNVATMTGTIGTFVYMSPEVLFNKSYTEKCDVYSFGIIMHEVFFEWRPYSGEGDSVIDALNPFLLGGMVTQGKRPFIPDMEYSERENEYLELMQKCWSQNADNRPSFDIILAFFEK